MAKKYNTTQLDPDTTFERHVYHRDQFAHYLRWTHALKRVRLGDKVLDFGCGTSINLAEVFYRNRFKCDRYLGLDIRKPNKKGAKLLEKDWIEFQTHDLVNDEIAEIYPEKWDIITSFEVIEHIGKQNADAFLQNIQKCCNDDTVVLLSTPVFDEKVGAAANHIINGEICEFEFYELGNLLKKYFSIKEIYGTFASQKDYKSQMNEAQTEVYNSLSKYYDANLISNIMAPMFPEHSRNALWVLKKKI